MRTTITLEPDVAEKIRQAARPGKRSQKQIINEALRRGLETSETTTQPDPFEMRTFNSPFRPGIDAARLNQLVDELDVDSQIADKLPQ